MLSIVADNVDYSPEYLERALTLNGLHIGNSGTLVAFRLGSTDAQLLAPEFEHLDPGALVHQEPFSAWIRRGLGRSGRDSVRAFLGRSILDELLF